MGRFFSTFFQQLREKLVWKSGDFYKTWLIWGNFHLLIDLHFNPVILLNSDDDRSIGAVCDSLGNTSLTSLVGYY